MQPEHAVEGGSSGSPPAVPPHPPAESIAVVTRASRGDFPILDRLIHTHPIWYLPNLGRAGAIHLLYNREEGVSQRSDDVHLMRVLLANYVNQSELTGC